MQLAKRKNTMKTVKTERITVMTLFLLPVIILISVYFVYSIISCFSFTFYDWNGLQDIDETFCGLYNWKKLLNDTTFWSTIPHNMMIMFASVVVELPLSMMMAYFLNRYDRKATAYKIVWFIPLLMSSAAIGTLSSFLYNNYTGPVAKIVKAFGLKMPSLLGDPKLAMYVICFTIVWQYAPFYMLYCYAGLNSIPDEIYEAATIDGANRRQYFFRCAIPMMAPTLKNAVILQIVGAMKSFDIVYTMTTGGPAGSTELMATYMYKQTFRGQMMGYGSTIAAMMFILITIVSLTLVRILNYKKGD